MLQVAIPYGTLSAVHLRPLACLCGANLRQGLRPSHNQAEPAVELAATVRYTGHSRQARRCRPALHPDQWQCVRNDKQEVQRALEVRTAGDAQALIDRLHPIAFGCWYERR